MVLLIVGIGILVLILAIWLTGRWKYFSEARAMTAPIFALTMIPAFYTVFGTSYQIDLMATGGIAQWWLYALSWYPAYVLGIIIGGTIRATGQHLTLPDRFIHHGAFSELLSSIVSFIYLMPLDVILMLGVLGSLLTNYTMPFWMFSIVLGIFLVAFTAFKGWSGYSLAGILYFLFMALGIGASSIVLLQTAGGWEHVAATVGPQMLMPWFTDIQGFLHMLTDPAKMVWFLMGFTFIIDPMVWQRLSLAESGKAVRRGMIFALLFWMVFDITTVISGLSVAALGEGSYLDTAYASLPTIWAGLVVTGNLMAALAGGSAYLHAGGMIFSQNIAKSLGILKWDVLASDERAKTWYRRGVFLLGGISIIITLMLMYIMPEAPTTFAWLVISGLLIGSLAFPLIFGGLFLRDKVPREAVNLSIISGLAVTLIFMIYGLAYQNAVGIQVFGVRIGAFGITPETASGTPFLDASRIYGLLASAIGWAIGWIAHIIREKIHS